VAKNEKTKGNKRKEKKRIKSKAAGFEAFFLSRNLSVSHSSSKNPCHVESCARLVKTVTVLSFDPSKRQGGR
jgi:hypothetical protein